MVQWTPASSVERKQDVYREINAILDSYPEVKSYIQISGFSIMSGGQVSNGGTYFVVLKSWDERKGKEHSVFSVVDRFNEDAYAIQEGVAFGMVPPAIPGLGTTGGLQMQLEDVNNVGQTAMQQAVIILLEMYDTKPAVSSMNIEYQSTVPQDFLNIKRDRVQFMGLLCNGVFITVVD